MDAYESVSESVEENEEHVTGNRRKAQPSYIVAENSAELCPAVVRKAELVNDEIKGMSKQCIEGVALCLLAIRNKI